MNKRLRYPGRLAAVIAAAAALTVTMLGLVPSVSAAASAPAAPRAHGASASMGAEEAALYPLERTGQSTVTSTCPAGRAELSRLARAGIGTIECVERGSAAVAPAARAALARPRAGATPTATGLCSPGRFVRTRHAACNFTGFTFAIIELPSGKVLGTGNVDYVYQESLSASSRKWTLGAAVELASATGVAVDDTVVINVMSCTGGCIPSPAWVQALVVGKVYGFDFTIDSPGTKTDTTGQAPHLTVVNPAAPNPARVNLPSLGPARCDSIAYAKTSGCVFSDVAAAYYVYLKGHNEDQVADNIEIAQKTKPHHFGWYKHGDPLTRATSSAVAADNRKAACGKTHYNKPYSCDEYPFAATFQGAHYFPADNRTAKVLGSQNSAEGAYRINMYRSERLLNKDAYWVFVIS